MVLFVEAITTNANMGIIGTGLHQVHTKQRTKECLCGNIAPIGPDNSVQREKACC